jgi:acyl-CoA thioesterase-1
VRARTERARAVAWLAATSLVIAAGPAGASAELVCATPEGFAAYEAPLPRTARALAGSGEVVVAVLGGSSTLGTAAGGPDLAWPARLGAALSARFPAARIKVVNLSTPRQTAREAADRVRRDVAPLRPILVIWETGTVEAVRGSGVEGLREALQEGIDALRATGTEVVLMSPQFSRDTDAMINFTPYLTTLRELADANDVPVFHRYGLMRHWAEAGVLDLRAKETDKRRKVAAKLYDCLGRAMANFLTRP